MALLAVVSSATSSLDKQIGWRPNLLQNEFGLVCHDLRSSMFTKNYFLTSGMASNFDKSDSDTSFNAPYDYNSIMHYGRTSFSKNGADTIQAKYDPYLDLGGIELSKYDIMKIKTMYRCNGKCFNGKKLSRKEIFAFCTF